MHQQEALSGPAVVMSFFRAAVEKDIGSVRMSEVRLEPYCDSRNRHWRTSWMDSTSEAARDLKTDS